MLGDVIRVQAVRQTVALGAIATGEKRAVADARSAACYASNRTSSGGGTSLR
jgi:hypothetical protein